MTIRRLLVIVALCCAVATPAIAQSLAPATPESVGLSSERVQRLKTVMLEYVEKSRIAGTVTLVARGGKLAHLESLGWMDVEGKVPMRTDTIFRIASMSKAVTSIAIVMLMEEGKLLLTDPVSKYIPAFKETTVAVTAPAGTPGGRRYGVVPAQRDITIRDLLTHTSGISYGMADSPAAEAFKAAGIQGWYFADRKESIASVIDRLAALPLDAQPGERYIYGFNHDILGVVVEKISGMPLDVFFKTRIFDPLRMVDSSFFLPSEKKSRLATVYAATTRGGVVRAPEGPAGQGDYVDGPRACFSGGAGLLSTAMDYARLLQMLLNGGELDGVRLLSPLSVELMTSNHVGSRYADGNMGFGLGFEVVEHVGRAGRLSSPGTFGWGSAYFSRYFVDTRERLVAVFLAQLLPARGLDLQDKFRALVGQTIVGPIPAAGPSSPKGKR